MKTGKTQDLVLTSILIALMLVMYAVPFLGFIPLGFMNATLMHIPVIVGAILLGPKAGALLGGVFGFTSFLKATFQPNATSFVFSPLYAVGDLHGTGWSLIVCFVPRILIGVVAYYVYRFLRRWFAGARAAAFVPLAGAGIAGSLTNTILVMNFIYLFFGRQYAQATARSFDVLYKAILSIIAVNGVPEAIVAAVVTAAACGVLLRLRKTPSGH
ncbi:MAG: ECF transporter S component [Oscillospiraceae bacterium]|jgi:uncharacterized membrane protein|nr:ECF transporter S component [Oscillospiraceae bacterium]